MTSFRQSIFLLLISVINYILVNSSNLKSFFRWHFLNFSQESKYCFWCLTSTQHLVKRFPPSILYIFILCYPISKDKNSLILSRGGAGVINKKGFYSKLRSVGISSAEKYQLPYYFTHYHLTLQILKELFHKGIFKLKDRNIIFITFPKLKFYFKKFVCL